VVVAADGEKKPVMSCLSASSHERRGPAVMLHALRRPSRAGGWPFDRELGGAPSHQMPMPLSPSIKAAEGRSVRHRYSAWH